MTNLDDTPYVDVSVEIGAMYGWRGSSKDAARAIRAAETVLRRYEVSATAACEAYWDAVRAGLKPENPDYPHAACAWEEAEIAANIAYNKNKGYIYRATIWLTPSAYPDY
jgi:hypothetical protein